MRQCINRALMIGIFISFVIPGVCGAITLTAPQTVEVGQPVTISVTAVPTLTSATTCFLTLDYGDGSPPNNSLVACDIAGVQCTRTVTHTYQRAGTYVIRAGNTGCTAGAFQPNSATRTISVVDLKIQRLDIFLNNRQPKMTVKQYQRDLKAFAQIRYTGAGVLRGQWEIDGRVFSKVNKQLYQGAQKITIQTPLAPPLPTYAVGTHRVRFVITRPELGIEFPQAIYFVEADPEPFNIPIRLAEPPDNKTTACAPFALRWQAAGKAYVYLVEFVEANSIDPTFSAYAKETSYTLREDMCRAMLSSGRAYRWRVKALSQEGHVIGESEPFNLYLVPDGQQ
jgi:hypothetical protein